MLTLKKMSLLEEKKRGFVYVNPKTFQAWNQVIGKGDKWTYNKLEKKWINWGSNPSGHVWYDNIDGPWSTYFELTQGTFHDIVKSHSWIVETEHLIFFGE